jgi:hypothetical protein
MSLTELLRLIPEAGSFLRRDIEDLRSVVGETAAGMPLPQRIFLQDEGATPLRGFPVLRTSGLQALRKALEVYVRAEEEIELTMISRGTTDKRPVELSWDNYKDLLRDVSTNAVTSSFGRDYPGIFWLYHSIAVSRILKEIPKHLVVANAEIGRKYGAEIKYRIFNRYLDRALEETYDVVQRAAEETEELEDELFPHILSRMRDNVLILTEDHVGPDLRELDAFFKGYLRMDGQNLRERLAALSSWHITKLEDPIFRGQIRGLLQLEQVGNPWSLLVRPGYVEFLSRLGDYDAERFFTAEEIAIWEQLLKRLKEFELLAVLRRFILPVHEENGLFRCPGAAVRGAAKGKKEIVLSYATRPLDFTTPWVVDPLVERFGLIYDITDFSSIVSLLRRSGSDTQDLSFRRIFGFQRKVNKIARAHRLQLEKYLGDGALYSGRHPSLLLAAAVRLQRHYREVVRQDFPFDRGMRLALNYGQYRLLPIEGGGELGRHRYEFFGHGIVELSRLVTGKATRELDEFKSLLVNQGYKLRDVEDFLAPLTEHYVSIDRYEENRTFFAHIDSSGALVNEGIVATRAFLVQAAADEEITALGLYRDGRRTYILLEVESASGSIPIGVRKLGQAELKGLEKADIYELVDAGAQKRQELIPLGPTNLLVELERQFRIAAGLEKPDPRLVPKHRMT